MKTLIATLAAATALTAGAAAAQPYGYGYDAQRYGYGYDQPHHGYQEGRWNSWTSERVQIAQRRIDQGERFGQLTHREAAGLRAELADFARAEAWARRDGVSWREHAMLDQRYDQLIYDIRREAHDRDYGYGYGYDYRR